jgi:DNA-binding YbaB/EbfC family protein
VKNIDMLRQAQKLQSKLLEELQKIKVEGSAGGGMVRIEMDGQQNVLSVKIEPQVLGEKDITMLEDLILAALHDAKKKVTEKTQESFKSITGFPIPSI